ncbi:MAG: hypothetical protein EOM20_08705 [Spartobacteria bacterium]|nr:hypothetical protein [Spartobacteria bacterium]
MRMFNRFVAGVIFLVGAAHNASAITHYVSPVGSSAPPYTNWSSAATNLHAAVGYAEAGATIVVAKAAYYFQSELLLTNPVTIVSYNGPSQTVLDGNYSTRCIRVATSNVVLSGFSVIHGNADKGGGIYCGASGVTISNCIVRENLGYYGGGLYLWRSDALVTHCTVISNIAYHPDPPHETDWPKSGGGGAFLEDSPTRFEHCLLAHNGSTNAAANGEGGGMMFFRPGWTFSIPATAVVVNCTISNNWTDYTGGGLACFGYDFDGVSVYRVSVINSLLTGNRAQFGGAFYQFSWGTKPMLYNCVLRDNFSTDNGVGIRLFSTFTTGNYDSEAFFENCTIVHNTSTNNYAVYVSDSKMYMVNSIIWSNDTLDSLRLDMSGIGISQRVEYSCIDGGYNGIGSVVGNIETNPLFADLEPLDWHLSAASPCIDAGTNRLWMWTATDFDGQPRIFNALVDMGADEAFVGVDAAAVTNTWHVPWMVVPEGRYDWQMSTASISSGWTSLSGIFTVMTDAVETDIPAPTAHQAFYRLMWQR